MWVYGIIFCLLILSHISVLKDMNSIDTNHFSFAEDTRFVVENYVDNIFSLWDVNKEKSQKKNLRRFFRR